MSLELQRVGSLRIWRHKCCGVPRLCSCRSAPALPMLVDIGFSDQPTITSSCSRRQTTDIERSLRARCHLTATFAEHEFDNSEFYRRSFRRAHAPLSAAHTCRTSEPTPARTLTGLQQYSLEGGKSARAASEAIVDALANGV